MTKKQKQEQTDYLNRDFGMLFLTVNQIKAMYPELVNRILVPNTAFTWENNIISVKFGK